MTVKILVGDALEVLGSMAENSVHMVCTSPPYWGLRDYGTGAWEGGDAACDHKRAVGAPSNSDHDGGVWKAEGFKDAFRSSAKYQRQGRGGTDLCRCGARRIDQQIGLESSPEEWAARLVEVFREVKRVLRPDGTCFVNCGSSYVSGGTRPSRSRQPERVPAYGIDGTALGDCSAPGSACPDPDGELRACSPNHHGHTLRNDQRHQPGASPPAQKDRDSEPLDCGPTGVGSSARGAPASTIQASSPNALDASGLACGASAGASVLTSEPATRANARKASSTSGTPASELPSTRRTGNGLSSSACNDPSCSGCGVCWAYLAIPLLKLKAKDLMMQAHLLALALQADGWWIRQEIVWNKPNPMPESISDRPTKSHEQVFLLTKSARYAYDAEAVREAVSLNWSAAHAPTVGECGSHVLNVGMGGKQRRLAYDTPKGANARSVWTIATEPFSGSHFATMPTELARRCILAGTSAKGCCPQCGAPWARMVERESLRALADMAGTWSPRPGAAGYEKAANSTQLRDNSSGLGASNSHNSSTPISPGIATTGWRPTCTCGAGEPVPCTILDPFGGSGTTGLVAELLGRDAILVELNPEYAAMAERRLAAARSRRMLGKVEPVPILPGQLGLFE